MTSATDVANFFIDIYKDSESPLTHLSIEKLVSIAQAISLAKKDKELFEEEIEAWKFGPVIPSVYSALSQHQTNQIKETIGEYSYSVFTAEQKDLLINVVRNYRKYSAFGLVELTHAQGSPWSQVYVEGENNIIPKSIMKDYYSKQDFETFDLNKVTQNLE